jgi:phage terminase small subunit
MSALKNTRHEKFCQGIVSGLSQTKAYSGAGYSERGAKQSAARLLTDADVRSRIAELRHEIESHFIRLRITEREERLKAKQWLWDLVRQAITYRALGDFAKMHATGIVRRRYKSVGTGNNAQIVEEYEIDTGAVEALNSIERRAAIETGQEVDRQDINLRGKVNDEAEVLKRAFSFEELEAMRRRIQAVIDAEQTKPAPPANIIDVKPILEDDSKREAASPQSASDQVAEGKRPSWRD